MRFSSIVVVVLAGGQGTRIRHLLPDLPKPMAPVLGRPFLEWVVRYLVGQGASRIVLATGYKSEAIERHFAVLDFPGIELRCLREPEPLGTAGGFLHAAAQIAPVPEAWLILNGDSLIVSKLAPLLAGLDTDSVEGAILGLEVADASRYGTLIRGEKGQLKGFAEKRPGSGLINAGVYLLRHSLLASFPPEKKLSFETEVFPSLIARGAKLQVVPAQGPFLDIGTPETLGQVEQFMAEHGHF